ncbi:ATP-binding protein [Rhizobium leguminosarum]|uniref:ATP-binding protein n=1 Tax=Rhizobium leguminosarum TaxID=384 RepID=UPI00102F5ED7|nr:ATP-binding protein [Rhizobium leguminosarum]TAX87427.1 ATP-binding protein [Rhizobium leguminosarum]
MSKITSILKRISHQSRKAVFPADFRPPIAAAVRKADGPPSALRAYLDYYRKLEAPGFAVLVTGVWGIGKTHQVIHSLDGDEFFHISLFGLRTAEELRSAVFAQMFPARHRIKALAGEATQSLHAASGPFALGGFAPSLLSAFLDREVTAERVLIFDDLERSRMPLKVLLGVINNYVEHFGCRVIVIVHDKKLVDPYLTDAKEKLFGQTLEALPQIDRAFAAFVAKYQHLPFGDFLAKWKQDVLDIFHKSNQPSLRLLRYLIEDLRRFHQVLDERFSKHEHAMAEAVKMISVFSIEVRAGAMIANDLTDRERQAADADSKIAQANARYGTIRLESNTLQDTLLTDMCLRGIFDANDICRNLEASVHFLAPGEDPPWRVVINFDKLDDEKVAIGLSRMNAQIAAREEIAPGEMLHILALRLMMAEHGISDQSPNEAVQEAMAYIDAMDELGRIPPRPLSYDWRHERYDAWGGIGYWVSEPMKPHFKQIVDHLKVVQEAALERRLQEALPGLLDTVGQGEKFFEKLVTTYTGNNPYAYVAILDTVDPQSFVKLWLAAPKSAWYWIGSAISERYKASFQSEALRRERPWARQVVALLEVEVEKRDGFARLRLSRTIPRSVGGPEDDLEDKPIIVTVGTVSGEPVEDPSPPTEPEPAKPARAKRTKGAALLKPERPEEKQSDKT